MNFKAIIAAFGMLALLGACDTMSEYGGKMSDSMAELGSSVKSAFTSDEAMENKYVVYFKSNSTSLTDGSQSTLADILNAARNEKVAKARVIAFTDSRGSPRYNQQLSMRRAESIKQKLSSAGVNSVEVSGAGEAAAASGGDGQSARRAEIYLIK